MNCNFFLKKMAGCHNGAPGDVTVVIFASCTPPSTFSNVFMTEQRARQSDRKLNFDEMESCNGECSDKLSGKIMHEISFTCTNLNTKLVF